MGIFIFRDAYMAVFDNGQLTEKGQGFSHTDWVDLAILMAEHMPASEDHIQALEQVFGFIDWSAVDVDKAFKIFHNLANIDAIGYFSRAVENRPELLDMVLERTFHRSSSDEVRTVLSNHPQWQPSIGLARDFMAHLVYNNFASDHDYHTAFGLFLQRCTPDTIICMFEQYKLDFFDPEDNDFEDNNWEISFVSHDIDQWSAQWPIEKQTVLHNVLLPLMYFPNMSARAQKHVLEDAVQDRGHWAKRKI